MQQRLESILQTVPFLATLGITVETARPGEVVLRLPARDDITGHGGTLHGGALYSVGEVAAGVALGTHPRLAALRSFAERGGIKYLRASTADVTAHASITTEMVAAVERGLEEHGRARLDVQVQIMDGYGADIAEVVAVFNIRG